MSDIFFYRNQETVNYEKILKIEDNCVIFEGIKYSIVKPYTLPGRVLYEKDENGERREVVRYEQFTNIKWSRIDINKNFIFIKSYNYETSPFSHTDGSHFGMLFDKNLKRVLPLSDIKNIRITEKSIYLFFGWKGKFRKIDIRIDNYDNANRDDSLINNKTHFYADEKYRIENGNISKINDTNFKFAYTENIMSVEKNYIITYSQCNGYNVKNFITNVSKIYKNCPYREKIIILDSCIITDLRICYNNYAICSNSEYILMNRGNRVDGAGENYFMINHNNWSPKNHKYFNDKAKELVICFLTCLLKCADLPYIPNELKLEIFSIIFENIKKEKLF